MNRNSPRQNSQKASSMEPNKPCCRCGQEIEYSGPYWAGHYWRGQYYCEICWDKIKQLTPDPEPADDWEDWRLSRAP